MRKTIALFLTLFEVLLSMAGTAVAQDDPMPPIDEPPIWNVAGLTIEYQRVNTTIDNQIATTHIEQLFVNDNDWMLEGTYLFPLPEGAAVNQLTMWVDGQPIEAKILEKEEARQIYDEIVRQLRDPALLEYVGTQAIQANVFPIPPHDERRIEIEYTQVLPADNGVIHYVYPQSTDLYTNTPLENQSIRVEVLSDEAIRAIYSPSHAVDISRDGDFRAVVGYEDSDVVADTDFELYYTVSPEEIGLNLLSYKEAGQDGFFTLLVAPSVVVDEVIAKDVIVVMDTSGSMEGEKMAQAQEAARYIVEHLNPEDSFNIVPFSTGVRLYEPALVSAENLGGVGSFINSLEAVGGTNISQALLEAAAMVDEQRPTTIIFLTDGLATEGITDTPLLLDAVKQAMPPNARIFVFGVGDDLDPNLLDALAENHRGTTTYVRPFQAIDEEVSSFFAKVSAPVLSDISLDFDGIVVDQLYPDTLPDLFAGSQLVLTGRYRDGGAATITLSGTVNGQPQEFVYEDNLFRTRGGDEFIPRLWATRAIGHLLREIRLRDDNPELVQSVVNLSIRYGIITPYTSYLIEEDDIFTQSGRANIAQTEGEAIEVTREVSEEMVAEAAASADMAAAEAPLALPTSLPSLEKGDGDMVVSADEAIRLVGSKTFVLRNGRYTDTTYDPDTQTPQPVVFASDTYFDLLAAAPELGQYFALGQNVLVVYEGQVYETVESGGVETVVLPEIDDGMETAVPQPANTQPTDTEPTPLSTEAKPEAADITNGICGTAMLMPLFIVTGLVGLKRKKNR
ncbi:MAG: VWA domain-containing protein [Anaerolineae bacterium]|nr:VWA domain-containing protein [Anaerolineae bacterium]